MLHEFHVNRSTKLTSKQSFRSQVTMPINAAPLLFISGASENDICTLYQVRFRGVMTDRPYLKVGPLYPLICWNWRRVSLFQCNVCISSRVLVIVDGTSDENENFLYYWYVPYLFVVVVWVFDLIHEAGRGKTGIFVSKTFSCRAW